MLAEKVFHSQTLIGRAAPCSLIAPVYFSKNERNASSKQLKANRDWYSALLFMQGFASCLWKTLSIFRPQLKPSSCMLCLAFWSTLILEECASDSYYMLWKDNMPTLECWHVAHDVSVCFLILCIRRPSEKRSNYSIALRFAGDQRAEALYCSGHAFLCHKSVLIVLCVKQGKDTIGLNTVHAHEKDIFLD